MPPPRKRGSGPVRHTTYYTKLERPTFGVDGALLICSEEVALKILKDASWDLEVAFETFFTMPQKAPAVRGPLALSVVAIYLSVTDVR